MRAVRFDLKWRYWAATALLLTASLMAWTFLSPPTAGSIVERAVRLPAASTRAATGP
jgi:hypothetical protein